MTTLTVDLTALRRTLISRMGAFLFFLLFLLLVPAGTLDFWEAYVYIGACLVPMIVTVTYYFRKDPEFLQRRMLLREKEPEQKKIVSMTAIFYLIGFLLPGFDHRFGWSAVSVPLVIAADLLVLASYGFIILVFNANRYAARVIQVEQEQTVISSGPYGIIRHPMYAGMIVMFLATPVALGSFVALPAFAMIPISMVFRILNEEKVLREQLKGYAEYCSKVRYRLIPFVW